MSIYRFIHDVGPGDPPEHAKVIVEFDDHEDCTIDAVVNAFAQFLRGVSFTDSNIREYLKSEIV